MKQAIPTARLAVSAAALLACAPYAAHAQQARVVTACGSLAPFGPDAAGNSALPTIDTTGKLCLSSSGGAATPPTNVQRFTALASLTTATPACQVNGCTPTGSGYVGASGTLTLTTNGGKFVCSTYPVLNATNTAGNITSATINTAGSCTVMGGTADEVWTMGGGLSGGSGALFSLTWTATAQTYTPTAGLKFALVYAYGAGGQGGGGASTVSTTASSGAGGGGGGFVNPCFISAASIGGSQTVTAGLGGRNAGTPSAIATGAGATGQPGGPTTFGSLCKGWGGGAGFGGVNAATVAGGGAGGGLGIIGTNGVSAASANGIQGGSGGTTTWPSNGGGAGGAQGGVGGIATAALASAFGGTGGGAGGGLTTTPSNNGGSQGGIYLAGGFSIGGGGNGTANNSGSAGNTPSIQAVTNDCYSGGGGGGSGLTTTVAGNGGWGVQCSGGGGGGSVVNGAGSAPGFGGPGGDGVLDVVEFF